ncbi:hypothetical protein INF26_00305 [Olsenella sp. DSM 107455]|uniref:Peptidase M28 domain-containing protein n=1 Tax=Thermophilibacter gallinarum TaxID=2779357 RepID=A0ABR9QQF4_9ACTN|nr:hypothetical protein [Thermophilibacter gallinarum]MBE5023309.1 hypothetical protein [Thermophilibacter gallinarum]
MAMTHDYLDFLNSRIDISPANSQEELQAAEVISDLMAQHDVEVSTEEFDEPVVSGLTPAILAIASLVGIVLVGVGVLPLTLIGFLLAVAPAAVSVARLFGHRFSISFGPRAQSQNVVAVHRATGPLVTKGSRTIVVVAHYDSPHENPLYTSPVAPYLTLASRLTVPCALGVAACAFIQILGFLPGAFRVLFWVVGILAAVPAAVLAVGSIAERMAPCTEGANDNKSGVAALLGILENVRPSGAEPRAREVAKPEQPEADENGAPSEEAGAVETDAAAPVVAPAADEPVLGTRHGEEVLRSLGILPESCEIEYVVPAAPEPAATMAFDVAADAETTREDLMSTGRFSVMDEGGEGVGPKDDAGLSELVEDFDPDATRPSAPVERPDAPSDPEWGKTSYRPQLSSVARRASLFDLPDPSENEADPFATDPQATRVQAPGGAVHGAAAEPAEAPAPAVPVDTITPEDVARAGEKPKRGLRSLLGRFRGRPSSDADAEPDGDAPEDDGTWRGGAAPRAGLRLVEDDESVADEQPAEDEPSEEELRDAVLTLGDDALLAHDIWFVALGGSSLGNAGMRAFLARHRSDIRGCFVVNLSCVGAGHLTALKTEGLEETRRADRRMVRLLSGVASDLHVELAQEPHDWEDTDATPAMRSSLRSVTLMGLGPNGLPALSRTADDVEDNVNGDKAAQVAALVTEMIRRS